MANNRAVQVKEQLDKIAKEYHEARKRSKHDDCSDVLSDTQVNALTSRVMAAISRIAGEKSPYHQQADRIFGRPGNPHAYLAELVGVVEALAADVGDGYVSTLAELIHGDIFGDFLEMADHLLASGYKDAAAVIAGSTIESHLRQLCVKSGIPVDVTSPSGTHPKKADAMNSDLAGASVYSKLDQKSITAWLGLRNDAAHGKYGGYTKDQVGLLIGGVRDFIARNPA